MEIYENIAKVDSGVKHHHCHVHTTTTTTTTLEVMLSNCYRIKILHEN